MEINRICKPGGKNCKMPELRRHITELQASLKLLYSWADNWDSPFMEDPEWIETDGPKIRALIAAQEAGDE